MMLNQDVLDSCEASIMRLTGERLKRGDTGWLDVMMRALCMGVTYKTLWESKHNGEIQHLAPTRNDAPASDGGGGAAQGSD